MSDARRGPDGFQYGVRFDSDGSITARWNGATQQARATDFLIGLAFEFLGDQFTLVRRVPPNGPWESTGLTVRGSDRLRGPRW